MREKIRRGEQKMREIERQKADKIEAVRLKAAEKEAEMDEIRR